MPTRAPTRAPGRVRGRPTSGPATTGDQLGRTEPCPHRAGRGARAQRDDAGSSAIELVLITPVLIALVFALIQTALVWNARHTVSSAAQHGARLARTATATAPAVTSLDSTTLTASDSQIQASTLNFLRQTGGSGLQQPAVKIERQGTYVLVTVSGTTVGVLPGTSIRVTGTSRTPIEGFRP